MNLNLQQLTVHTALAALKNREFSCAELIDGCFTRIREHDGEIRAFLTLTEEEARRQAQEIDRRISRNEPLRPLEGIPVAVKDVICTQGVRTTAASRILENYIPPYDATVVAKLKAAGAVMVGKTNCDEFAHGASTENSAYGPSHNPWDLERSPGGSSGGSAAALSAGFCLAALGTDTGGSTRQPAGWCNLYGLRPTYGRISRYGLIAMTSSTDTPGIFAKTAGDTAFLLSILAGQDEYDATSLPSAVEDYSNNVIATPPFAKGGGSNPGIHRYDIGIASSPRQSGAPRNDSSLLNGLKIGLPREFFSDVSHPASRELIDQAINSLEELGAQIMPVSLPHTKYAVPVYYIITPAEISSNLGRFDGIRYGYSSPSAGNLWEVYTQSRGEGFGPEATRRIMLGTYTLSAGYYDAYYKQAQKVRTIIADEVKSVFNQVDVLATPVSPHPAIHLGEKVDDPLAMYLEDVFMGTAVMAGIPGLSIPAGFVRPASPPASADGGRVDGLPVGLQLMGPQLSESTLLSVAHAYEQEHEWTEKHPAL